MTETTTPVEIEATEERLKRVVMVAAEIGYRACEKGQSLTWAMFEVLKCFEKK